MNLLTRIRLCALLLLAGQLAHGGDLPYAESGTFSFDAYDEVSDSDGDGMPDAWEMANSLNILVNDAAGNPDGDPFTNLQEYNAGTDPRVADTTIAAQGLSPQFVYSTIEIAGDADSDGLPDSWEALYSLDGGVANADGDPDSDGLTNLEEFNGGWNPIVANNEAQLASVGGLSLTDTGAYPAGFSTDSDGDGMPDWWESRYGLSTSVNDAGGNPDGDELTNLEEYMAGRNPTLDDQFGEGFDASGQFIADTIGGQIDTDGDLMPDVWESANGLNPLVPDANDDPDGDGWNNLQEYNAGTNPQVDEWIGPDRLASALMLLDTGAYPLGFTQDTDGDGMPDWWEDRYGLSRIANDAGGNSDGDAYTNVEEYQKGLHPSQSDFVFVINGEGTLFLLDTGGEFVDSDLDGIPNWWERKYSGNPTSMSPTGDEDGDGQNNLAEYISGLIPTDATSVFKVAAILVDHDPNGQMTIQWDSQLGRRYHLYVGDSPADLGGAPFVSVNGDGTTLTRLVPKNGKGMLFCRISVEMAE